MEKKLRDRLNDDPKFVEIQPRAIINAFRRELQKAPSNIRHRIAGMDSNGPLPDGFERHQTNSEGPFVTALLLYVPKDWMDGTVILPSGERRQILVCEEDSELWFEDETRSYVTRHLKQQKIPFVPRRATKVTNVATTATVSVNDSDDAVPPEWVPWRALLYWVVWIVRRYYRPEFDEATAKRWMPDVVQALRHDVDNRIEPRLGLWEVQASGEDALAGGRFVEEIDWLDNYVVESWSTGSVQRRVPQEGDPPGFTLAAHWVWLMTAVQQVAQQAGLALRGTARPVERASDDLAPSQSQPEVEADEAELRRAKAEADAEALRQELLAEQIAREKAEADAAKVPSEIPLEEASAVAETSQTLIAFVGAGEGAGVQTLSTKARRERQIVAWLVRLHQEQPEGRPNLNVPTIRERWGADKLKALYGITLAAIRGIYDLDEYRYMRGEIGKPNRPK
jgi:hypothetical protein